MALSLAEQLAVIPESEQEAWIANLPDDVIENLARNPWWFIGRPEQQEPESGWSVWLILAGRGWGKTRTCAEWLAHEVLSQPYAPDGMPTEWAIIAETFGDTRTVCTEGPSGILHVLERQGLKKDVDFFYNRSAWQIRFKEGQRIHMLGADNPDAGRGFNLAGIWADEVAKWRYPYETWTEGIAPALRIGRNPRAVIATTPKPIKLLREWVARTDGSVHVTRGSTFDNAANLSPAALIELRARYEGTRIGAQELYGELLTDIEGALWKQDTINDSRVDRAPFDLQRVVVAVDPAVTSGEDSDETGIIVAAKNNKGEAFILADYTLRASPLEWAKRAVEAYRMHEADAIVVETNNGGDMIPMIIKQVDPSVKVTQVRASRGKRLRAEPVAAMYEQGRVHHVGVFEQLETQMTIWTPDDIKSPDRLDAMVWAITDLLQSGSLSGYLSNLAVWCDNCNLPMPKSQRNCSKCGSQLIESDDTRHPLGA